MAVPSVASNWGAPSSRGNVVDYSATDSHAVLFEDARHVALVELKEALLLIRSGAGLAHLHDEVLASTGQTAFAALAHQLLQRVLQLMLVRDELGNSLAKRSALRVVESPPLLTPSQPS